MAYQAIYRKWRPKVFEDIIGQTHITKTLKNQIINDQIGHAYLFCGTRGTGKTTAAKIFSRAVNCLNPQDGSPCNECEICKGILNGSIMDISEIDAASNNGIDEVRNIREDTKYSNSIAKYRVYIIDEVHMLSTQAFNALLKILEEPPEYVVFILATTEPHKVPQTILSRCQRYDFKRIMPSDIIVRMKEIAYGDGLEISDDAYILLARLADGSMRDGLSILDRVAASSGNKITVQSIMEVLSITDIDIEFKMADAIAKYDSEAIFEIIDEVVSSGRDLSVFISHLVEHFRNLLVCKITHEPDKLLDYSADEIVRFKLQAEKITNKRISHVIDTLSVSLANNKWLKSPRVAYELSLLKLCIAELDTSPSAIADRISAVEEKIKNGIVAPAPAEEKKKSDDKPKVEKEPVSHKLYNPIPKSQLTNDNPLVKTAKKWDTFVKSFTKTYPNLIRGLSGRNITIDADGIIIIFEKGEEFLKHTTTEAKNILQDSLLKYMGVNYAVKTAFREEIEDYIVDFWGLTNSNSEVNTDTENDDSDPLASVIDEFADVITNPDESDFQDYDPSQDKYEQSNVDESYSLSSKPSSTEDTNDDADDNADDDENEEFLDESELESEE